MWNDSFVLADRIKGKFFLWIGALIAAATAADVAGYANEAALPLTIFGVVAQTFIVVAALNVGQSDGAGVAIRPRVATVFGIALLSGLGILVGALLLVIPGLFLLVRWWVAVPVALDRNLGAAEALRESWAMTADHWLPIAGLLVGLLAIFAIPAAILFMVGGVDEEQMALVPSLLLNSVIYGVTNFGTVSTVAVYRAISERAEDLRAVFE